MSAKLSDTEQVTAVQAAERRQRDNVRLGLALGAVAVVLFLIALWKYRPL